MNYIAYCTYQQLHAPLLFIKRFRSPLLYNLALLLFAAGLAGLLSAQDIQLGGSLSPSVFALPAQKPAVAFTGLRGTGFLQGHLGDNTSYRFSAETYINSAGLAESSSWESSTDTHLLSASLWGNSRLGGTVELKEAWLETSLGDLDLRLGKQLIAWGLADGNNPTDTINARHQGTRYTTTLDEQKISSWMFNGTYYLPNNLGTIQALILPISIPNDLPSIAMTIPGSGSAPTIVIKEDSYPEFALENIEGGLQSLFYLGNLSFSASYFTFLDRYPDFSAAVVGGPSTTITYTPVHNRIHQFGLDAAYVIAGFDIRSEWALIFTKDLEGIEVTEKNPYLQGVLQASRSFINSTTTLSLAWAPRYVLNYKAPEDYSSISDQQAAIMIRQYDGQAYQEENGLSLRLAGKYFNETLQPELLFLVETSARDWLGTASISYQLADGISLKAGTVQYGSFLAESDPDRELGTFSKASTIDRGYYYIELKFSF
ncbi:DUF1302 family protein [Gracilinema caldarium]|uniref:Uncharacterized protein n=1 Tax=Gracilinema caldarium (strain ATCC 51460 / DSM 7334 / H1) TaxID=744872 RepID=F8EY88_GRAC1|nr:DUF1302 family protein [Gracilinema caldarium]AEJ18247.1 hypothetical protein Spica_0075 [Gracilinema caldarium DSM 7334]